MFWIFKCFLSSPKYVDINDHRLLEDECAFCLLPLQEVKCIELDCGHIYHKDCFDSYVKTNRQYDRSTRCPYCDIHVQTNYL